MKESLKSIARMIDHSLLHPTLTDQELLAGCQLARKYDYRGATDQDLILMRRECVDFIQVKAAGGIRTLDDILRVKALGVTRVGATATESILSEAIKRGYD